MADDKGKQVTEPEEEEDEDDFSAVFSEEPESGESDDDTDKSDEEEDDKEDDEESDEPETKEPDDEDDLITRGKGILDAEEKQQKEQEEADKKAAAEEAKKKAAEEAVKPLNETDVSNLMGIVNKNELPDKEFDINGIKVNPREFIDDNPEALVIGGLMAVKTIQRMTQSGALISGKALEQKIKDSQDMIWGNTFSTIVTMWHSDAEKVVQSDEYTKWLDDQKNEIKALVKTGNPLDLIDVINRYKEDNITNQDTKKKDGELDKKAAADKKKKIDDLMRKSKSKKKPTPTLPELNHMGNTDEGFAEGFNQK